MSKTILIKKKSDLYYLYPKKSNLKQSSTDVNNQKEFYYEEPKEINFVIQGVNND